MSKENDLVDSSDSDNSSEFAGVLAWNVTQVLGANPAEEDITSDEYDLPFHLKAICLVMLLTIFIVGTIGNILVIVVISCSRDMRTSTNVYLVNLSIADLLVLLVCSPTFLIELVHHPDIWILGPHLCKLVPLLEATVLNVSVLTILAISFERYYAICRPLKANYICTKARAMFISGCAWMMGIFIASPMHFMMMEFLPNENDPSLHTGHCIQHTGNFWQDLYTISTIILLFLVPLVVLIVAYGLIAHKLSEDRSELTAPSVSSRSDQLRIEGTYKARKQVVIMLGTVVFTFFLCLLPFQVLKLYVVFIDVPFFKAHKETFFNIAYFSRLLVYMNSAINPILYGFISSKFRLGLLRICLSAKKVTPFRRAGTLLTSATLTNSTNLSMNGNQHRSISPIPNSNGLHVTAKRSLSSAMATSMSYNNNNSNRSRDVQMGRTLNDTIAMSSRIVRRENESDHLIIPSPRMNPIPQLNNSMNNSEVQSRNPNESRQVETTSHGFLCENEKHAHHPKYRQNSGLPLSGSFWMENNNKDFYPNSSKATLIKSDSMFCAYLEGKRDETIL